MTGIALIRIWREFQQKNLQAKLILTVHDSIAAECPDNELADVIAILYRCMTTPIKGINVKMDAEVEFGRTWGSLQSCNVTKIESAVQEYLNPKEVTNA